MISLCEARNSCAAIGEASEVRDHLRKITLAAHHAYTVSKATTSRDVLAQPSPTDSTYSRKKRKLSAEEVHSNLDCVNSSSSLDAPIVRRARASQISLDFLSGIFQDLNQVQVETSCDVLSDASYTNTSTSAISPAEDRKRVRAGSLTSVRSLASLSRLESCWALSEAARPPKHNALAAEIVDTVFASHDIPMFPELPHTISASSCSSNHLTLTSVPAAQVNYETSLPQTALDLDQHEEYGFYVDLDNDTLHQRLECVSKASETCRRSLLGMQDLAFVSVETVAHKEDLDGSLDSETAWAKAADTVDDVLGDLF